MNMLVSGASGLIGSALTPALEAAGHQVSRLVRRSTADASEVSWDPSQPMPPTALSRFDAVIHLAGRNIGTRWTAKVKQEARESRVVATQNLAASVARSFGESGRPTTFISASAIGIYGSRGDELLTEASTPGAGFLADLARDWEAATKAASDAGVRVVLPRISMVLSKDGGGLPKMLPPFRLGLGGPVGSGRQWMSWVAIGDLVASIKFMLESPSLSGPVNLSAPEPVTNREFVKALGAALRRPALFPLPAAMVRLMFGEMGEEVLLGSTRVVPSRLEAAGFKFQCPSIDTAFRTVLAH